MDVSEVDSASLGWDQYTAGTAEGSTRERNGLTMMGAITWKNTHVGSPKGESLHTAPSAAQGLTLGIHTSAGPGV